MPAFLPMTSEDTGGRPLDVLLVTGDAYVDHPAWGIAAVGRWLEAEGFTVGIVAQPDPEDPDAFRVLGRPRLFMGVSAGNMDSMVNAMTASRARRDRDAYSRGGDVGLRPDRATNPYTAAVRRALPGVPVVLGGIEASLRRLVHYDYWQDRVRGSILLDAKADLLVIGMGERAVTEIARRLAGGAGIAACRDIPGVAWAAGARDPLPEDAVELPSLEECRRDPLAFNRMTVLSYREANPRCGRRLVQRHGDRALVQNPPAPPLSTAELDRLHELPYVGEPHPCYRAAIPAFQSIAGSVTVNRGCAGGCSFCALTVHQGKDVVSRSAESVLREIARMTGRPGFNGVVTDLGGPTANMYHMACTSPEANAVCRRVSCLHPVRCKHFGTDHGPYIDLLRAVRSRPGVRQVYVISGIRTDLAMCDPRFVDELARHHVQGQLSVAPEHASDAALDLMHKPAIGGFDAFVDRFHDASARAGRQQYLVPYFQAGHPGTGPAETVELALYMKARGLRPRQVQMFMPTPGTLATAMWVSGRDPFGGAPVAVARGGRERSRQRALLHYWKRDEAPHVREALRAWGRADLIGTGPQHLVAPGPAWGAWERRREQPARPAAAAAITTRWATTEQGCPRDEAIASGQGETMIDPGAGTQRRSPDEGCRRVGCPGPRAIPTLFERPPSRTPDLGRPLGSAMGWAPSSWFAPKVEKQVARARKWADKGEFNEVLRELEGLDGPEVDALRSTARLALIQINLEEWRAQNSAGNRAEAHGALERARAFGASREEIEAFQREARQRPR